MVRRRKNCHESDNCVSYANGGLVVWLRPGVGVWLAVCRQWSQQPAPLNNFHLSRCQNGNLSSDVCYCALWTLRDLLISAAAADMSQVHAVTHAGDNVCDQHLISRSFLATFYVCLDSVDRMQFLKPPFIQVFWIPASLSWIIKLHLIDFTFAFKLVSELVDLGLEMSVKLGISQTVTVGLSILHQLSAWLLCPVLDCTWLNIHKKSAKITVKNVSFYPAIKAL